MKLSDKSQLDELMDQASYDAYTEENDEQKIIFMKKRTQLSNISVYLTVFTI